MRRDVWFGVFLGLLLTLALPGMAVAQSPPFPGENPNGTWHLYVVDDTGSPAPFDAWTLSVTPSGETRSEGFVSGNGEVCRVDANGVTSGPIRLFGDTYTGPINFAVGPSPAGGEDLIGVAQRADGSPNSDLRLWIFNRSNWQDLGPVPTSDGESTGMSMAFANILGDSTPEIVLGSSPGVPGRIYIGELGRDNMVSFFPFGQDYRGGVRVATGNLNHDAFSEVIATQVNGGGFRAFEIKYGIEPMMIGDGLPFGPAYDGGIWPSAFDTNGDGVDEVFVGRGTGPPMIRVFNIAGPTPTMVGNFIAFGPNATGGVRISTGFVKGRPTVAAASGPNLRMFQYTESGDWRFDSAFAPNPFGPRGPIDIVELFTPPRPPR